MSVAIAVAALAIGVWLGRSSSPDRRPDAAAATPHEAQTVWTCSMHPQIRLPEPGKCPICFMDLIPVDTGATDDGAGPPRLAMSDAAKVMAEIETVSVVQDRPFVDVRVTGKVDYDETRISALTARVPGRLDRLYVDYTGIAVRKGDHLAEIYSPELLSAQEELLQALRARERISAEASPRLKEAADATVTAARDKLRLLDVTTEQIAALEAGREPSDHVTLYAQTGGVVIEKNAVEGDYVATGAVIYRIADLSHVWVKLDAYESDLAWLRYGQEVDFTAEALPGKVFRGRISFVAPTLDPRTRTVKVRVNVDNSGGVLKPEMFVRATVLAEVDAAGQVVTQDLAGKWICPMHPEVVKNRAGACDVCGMDLVSADQLGYVRSGGTGHGPLVIPRSAVLFTGKRAIVYVEVPDAERPTYEGREVVLGPRAGDRYVVESGLSEGERVVVRGNFKIDSALQIQAKPSMMSPPAHEHAGMRSGSAAFREALAPLYAAYLELGGALAGDDLEAARGAAGSARDALGAVATGALSESDRREWDRLAAAMKPALATAGSEADLDSVRAAFDGASQALMEIESVFGHAGDGPLFVAFCPMAFGGRGASWVQDHETISNPWFGAKMLRCGEIRETLAAAGGDGG